MSKRVPWANDQFGGPFLSHHILFWLPFLVDMTVSGVPERVWDNRSKQADDEQTAALEKTIKEVSRVPGEG